MGDGITAGVTQRRWAVGAALCSRCRAWTAGDIAGWSVPYSLRSGRCRFPDDSRDGRAISLACLAVHDASSVCVASVGYSSSRTGSVAWRLVLLPPAMRPLSAARRVLTLGMEALSAARRDRHRTATAMVVWGRCQQCSVTQACRSVLAEQPIGSVVASQACHGVMLASVLVVVCSLA